MAILLLAAGCGSDSDSNGSGTGGMMGTAGTGGAAAGGTNGGGAGGTAGTSAMPGNIVQVASSLPQFSTLVAAVQKAELVDTLSGAGPFTVFAPTNAAFDALLTRLNTTLEAATKEDLIPVLTYHVVMGRVAAADVVNLKVATTLGGGDFRIQVEGTSVRLLFGGAAPAMVTMTDVPASNGLIHVIDTVMLPPGDLATVASGKDDFTTLVAALQRADLVDAIKAPGPFTVFAPTNAAFASLLDSNPAWESLQDIPLQTLTDVLKYHVVMGKVYSENVVTLTSANTLLTGKAISINAMSGVKLNGDTNVAATDVLAKNGVIHVIDKVLIPPQ